MRKSLAFVLCFVLFFVLVGCGDQTNDANRLINQRNAHNKAAEQIAQEIKDLSSRIGKAQTVDELKKELDTVKEAQGKVEEAKKEISSGLKNLKDAKELNISSEFKTYIGLLISADNASAEGIDLLASLLDETVKFYDFLISKPDASNTELDPYINKVQEYRDKITAKGKEAEELDKKAQDYYKEKKLGSE